MTDKEELVKMLAGSWTPKGVERWFVRPRSWLDGQTPQQILDSGDPEGIQMLKDHLQTYLR
jgi:hypothetical protein